MAKFLVEGGHPVSGTIRPAGNKNEALPILAAALLTGEEVHIQNVPGIGDVNNLLTILESIGAATRRPGAHEITIRAETVRSTGLPVELCQKIRASVLLSAPLLVRCGHAEIPLPGGDRIGRRRIDTHLFGFEALGAKYELADDVYRLWCDGRLKGADILLDEASVTATENLVMAAALAEGETILRNAASEPHVQQLCNFLNHLGARIEGIGSNVLTIQGVERLRGGTHCIAADYLEVGSFIALAAVTHGELLIQDAAPEYMRMILTQFQRLGIEVEIRQQDIFVPSQQPLKIKPDLYTSLVKIDDGPWPAFPADMMSIALVAATQTQGTVMIFEKMFESRLFFVDRLISMGANIILCDPHRAVVVGPTPLSRRVMSSPDIRAGMALLIAALCAQGISEIQNIEQIDRGYERLDERLAALGARIHRVEG
ncbi:MAG TPA: UDP-N-acetylglucosamine 1-carboxyvinyltransferase [bacterium]|nr:UDP-N-acetylglucosamine 1-carboxyvinyltransferase [Candidatus Omnitrophota bacterium]HOJ60258.1 UDP-N-acetylglucosamine 1-carboxyvinyltransferase [bacterium]HOL93084.1 UDP-N-acetylglucosamine 1-carboxyvinyltransferase [bacterium]HPO99167.1 UDP-N-acetylglucosamine 1-carboxyvinyltransferase [bacterium]HXK94185.1 UDP-N-acetylglucosamine 1-carboxyvinyltransferase [bacterium]